MNAPTSPTLNPFLLEHYASFETRRGRLRLHCQLHARRVFWAYLIHGTHVAKRLVDIVLSFAALVVLSPLFLLIAALIKLEGDGPIIFPQLRIGRHGREFFMLKFRSMHPDAEARLRTLLAENQHGCGVTFKIKNDPRITRVGRWLRKYSLDELPQFFNVLRGDMSLVGPRPPVPREVALYSLADRRRLAVKPGITCIWQISGRAQIDFPGQVRLDVDYIERRNFWQDIRILFATIPAVLRGTGAY